MEIKILKLQWIDSHSLNNWAYDNDYIEEASKKGIITSIGYLLKETKDYYLLVQSYGNEQVSNGIMIYKKTVVKKELIKWK